MITCLVFVGFLLLPCPLQAQRAVEIKSREDLSHQSGKLGAYRALVIGINDYQDKKIPALKTAVNDAREVASLLQTRYGFKVDLLLDRQATRQAIMDKMRDLAANATPDESVLIYYAGHGEIDRVLNDGWWVPADAQGGKRRPWSGRSRNWHGRRRPWNNRRPWQPNGKDWQPNGSGLNGRG